MLDQYSLHTIVLNSAEELTVGDDRDGLGLVEICFKQNGKITQSIVLNPHHVEQVVNLLLKTTRNCLKKKNRS
jgi:hypothetical protein